MTTCTCCLSDVAPQRCRLLIPSPYPLLKSTPITSLLNSNYPTHSFQILPFYPFFQLLHVNCDQSMCLLWDCQHSPNSDFLFFFSLSGCFTSFFVFRIADLPHSPGVVYYHLLLRRETRIPGVAPFSFGIGIWDLFVHRGQESHTPTAFGKLRTTPGVRCIKHASS